VEKLIRTIFSIFVLVMIALFVMRLNAGMWTTLNWVMMAIAALSCLLVFRCFVYIFNFSYALACVFNGTMLALEQPVTGSILLGGAMVIYGVRLFSFAWYRYNSESYRPRLQNVLAADAKLPFPLKIIFLVQCTFLYTFHLFAIYLVGAGRIESPVVVLAAIIILIGIALEGFADKQKQNVKQDQPGEFAKMGLYARWRHPNYAGEIVVQTGLILAGITAVSTGWANYAAVVVAPLYVILLMISECITGDKRLEDRHGADLAFQQYKAQSGSVFPRF
jgi:steroid 5-alpha reductase family enzyme